MRKYFLPPAILISLLIIVFPQISLESARNSLILCGSVVIPSMFPFLVCSNLLISLGAAQKLTRAMSYIMMPLFKVRGSGALALIFGVLSGYPCGAATVCSLYSSGSLSKNEAHRLLAFTNNSGPLFIISAVGIGIYKSATAGIVLYAAHLLAALTVGILSVFFADNNSAPLPETSSHSSPKTVISDSVLSMLNLCGYVVFFSVVLSLLGKIGILATAKNILRFMGVSPECANLLSMGIIEITTAISSAGCTFLPATAAIISLGGISVLFQTMSLTKSHSLSIMPYIIGKIFSGGFSALYSAIILSFFPVSVNAFSPFEKAKLSFYVPYLSAVLISAAIFLVIYVRLSLQGDK